MPGRRGLQLKLQEVEFLEVVRGLKAGVEEASGDDLAGLGLSHRELALTCVPGAIFVQ